MNRDEDGLRQFEQLRPELIALAYRMLGDVARAQDMVQEAWLRWHEREVEVESPKAFLVTVVTRLCLNELSSARARKEQRADHLPEPVDIEAGGMAGLERVDQISMAFMVMLERLAPAERAVMLLHDVFDFPHEEIGKQLGRTTASSRKLLERAREKIASGRKLLSTSPQEHARLLEAFIGAARSGDAEGLLRLLAEDATLITDGGAQGRRVGRLHNLRRPLVGAEQVASFIAATANAVELRLVRRELNGQPAMVLLQDGRVFAAILLGISEGKVQHIYFHGDLERLRFVAPREVRS